MPTKVELRPNVSNWKPVQIIADYILRFLRNNKDVKLSEAKERIEKKISLFAADGFNREELLKAFAPALRSRSCLTFKAACKAHLFDEDLAP